MWNPYVSVSITLARLRTHTKFTRNAMDALTEIEFKLVLFDVLVDGKFHATYYFTHPHTVVLREIELLIESGWPKDRVWEPFGITTWFKLDAEHN